MDWSICCFTLLKNISYETVLENFIPIFTKVVSLTLEIKKYVDEFLARSKFMALLAPEQILPMFSAEISFGKRLAIQRNVGATIGIFIPK